MAGIATYGSGSTSFSGGICFTFSFIASAVNLRLSSPLINHFSQPLNASFSVRGRKPNISPIGFTIGLATSL